MAKGQATVETQAEVWEAGEYVLVADRFTDRDQVRYVKGDTLVLDEAEATRMGNAGAVVPAGSLEAKQAQATQIEDEAERERRLKALRADALEAEAKRLRGEAGGGA